MKIRRANIHQFCQRYQGTNSPDGQGRGTYNPKLVPPVYGWSKMNHCQEWLVSTWFFHSFLFRMHIILALLIHVQYLSQELSILSFVYPPYMFFFAIADYSLNKQQTCPCTIIFRSVLQGDGMNVFQVLLGSGSSPGSVD